MYSIDVGIFFLGFNTFFWACGRVWDRFGIHQQELSEHLGLRRLNERLQDPTLQTSFSGIFPKDTPKNMRFSINFFTSIGLGGLTEELREYLANMPKMIMQQQQQAMANAGKGGEEDDDESNSSDNSDSSESSEDSDSSDSTEDSSEESEESEESEDSEEERKRKKRRR